MKTDTNTMGGSIPTTSHGYGLPMHTGSSDGNTNHLMWQMLPIFQYLSAYNGGQLSPAQFQYYLNTLMGLSQAQQNASTNASYGYGAAATAATAVNTVGGGGNGHYTTSSMPMPMRMPLSPNSMPRCANTSNASTSATPLPQGSMKATDVGTIMSCGVEKSSAISGASSVLKPVAHWVQQPTMTNNMSAQIPPVQLDMTKKVAPPFHTPTPNMTGYPNTTTKLSNIPSPHLRNYDTPVAVPLVPQSVRTPPLGSSPGSAFQKRN